MDKELMRRLLVASQAYFDLTDDVDAMHMADVLHILVNGNPEGILEFYEKEVGNA